MPFLNFSSAHRDAVARAFDSSRSPAGPKSGDSSPSISTGSAYSAGGGVSGSEDGSAILRAALAASLT